MLTVLSLMFIKVTKNLFRSHANHLESCEFLVLAAEACSGPLETGLSAELWVTHERRLGGQAEWDSTFGTLVKSILERV